MVLTSLELTDMRWFQTLESKFYYLCLCDKERNKRGPSVNNWNLFYKLLTCLMSDLRVDPLLRFSLPKVKTPPMDGRLRPRLSENMRKMLKDIYIVWRDPPPRPKCNFRKVMNQHMHSMYANSKTGQHWHNVRHWLEQDPHLPS